MDMIQEGLWTQDTSNRNTLWFLTKNFTPQEMKEMSLQLEGQVGGGRSFRKNSGHIKVFAGGEHFYVHMNGSMSIKLPNPKDNLKAATRTDDPSEISGFKTYGVGI